ncbi:MAG: hypothetical protein J2P28_02835 [Actinobacteria bacterium]|nr:hypothetical protein [Actinomycetota bacterium]
MTITAPQVETMDAVRAFVLDALNNAGSEYHTGRLAVEIYERLREEDPDLADRFAATLAVDQLKLLIARTRGLARRASSPLARKGYDITEAVDGANTQRRLGDMVRSDLDRVARNYDSRAKTYRLRASRFRALRDRMPDEVTLVRDVIPEAEVEAIYNT